MPKQNLTFSQALEAFKDEQGIRRPHWAEGVHLKLKKGSYPIGADAVETIHGIHPKHFEFGTDEEGIKLPYAQRIHPDKGPSSAQSYLSVSNLLAQDWEII